MKLATLKNHTRDGKLVVVSRDMTQCSEIPSIARTMQQLLDEWDELSPLAKAVFDRLNSGQVQNAGKFASSDAMAPLPRAFQWCDGSAYLSHAELVRKARNAEMPSFLYDDPLMYQGASDTFLGPNDDIEVECEDWGIDLEAELAVITDDVPMGLTVIEAQAHIRLLTLLNDISLRNLIPHELSKGFGFFHSKPSTSFAPIALTPDELGSAWDGSKVTLPVVSSVNSVELGRPNAGIDLNFDFPRLIAHAAKSRRLGAGTIVGSGTVSNRDPKAGSSCLAECRMLEIISGGSPSTPFLKFGDEVAIEVLNTDGKSVFGEIRQKVVPYLVTSDVLQTMGHHENH